MQRQLPTLIILTYRRKKVKGVNLKLIIILSNSELPTNCTVTNSYLISSNYIYILIRNINLSPNHEIFLGTNIFVIV
jgi:hypothetical protein